MITFEPLAPPTPSRSTTTTLTIPRPLFSYIHSTLSPICATHVLMGVKSSPYGWDGHLHVRSWLTSPGATPLRKSDSLIPPEGVNWGQPSVSGGGSWAPPVSVLESWLSWSCTGLIWATIATMSSWTERSYVQEASFCSSPQVLWFFQSLCLFIACVWSSTVKGEIDAPCVTEHQIDTCFLPADGWFCVKQKPLRQCASCSKHRYGRALLKPSLLRVFPKQFLTY